MFRVGGGSDKPGVVDVGRHKGAAPWDGGRAVRVRELTGSTPASAGAIPSQVGSIPTARDKEKPGAEKTPGIFLKKYQFFY